MRSYLDLTVVCAVTSLLLFLSSVHARADGVCIGAATDGNSAFVSVIGADSSTGLGMTDALRRTLAIAKDGSKIAYVSSTDAQALNIVSIQNFATRFDIPQSARPISGVEWMSPNIVRIERHLGRDGSEFTFYRLSDQSGAAIPIGETQIAVDCVISTSNEQIACIDAAREVSVAGSVIFKIPAEAISRPLNDASVAVGSFAESPSIPGVSVEYRGVKLGAADLVFHVSDQEFAPEVGLSSGQEFEARDPAGDVFYVTPDFGADMSNITLHFRMGDADSDISSAALAESNDGEKITIVRGKYAATLELSTPLGWQIASSGHLPSDTKALAMRFSSPYDLIIKGAEDFFRLTTSDYKVPAAPSTPVVLPKMINVAGDGSSTKMRSMDMACN